MPLAVMRLAIMFLIAGVLQARSVNRNDIVVMEITGEKHHQGVLSGDQTVKDTAKHPPVSKFNVGLNPARASESNVDVVIKLDSYVNEAGPMFVGVTLDSSVFRREWKIFNTSSKQLQSLAKGIAPSLLRVGGSAADFFIFNTTTTKPEEALEDKFDYDFDFLDDSFDYDFDIDKPLIKNYTVTASEWKQLNDFIQKVGWNLIFDFNEFLREGDAWDPDNARKLLTFSQEQNFAIPYFQLGNEPNSYHHNFNFTISGSRLAKDMQELRSLLAEYPAYRNSQILGPDVTRVTKGNAKEYLEEFLQTGGQNIVAAVTFHHYYFNAKSHGASLSDFVNTTILNLLKRELSIACSVSHALAPGLPLWLSETSSVSGGGLAGVSDGYAAGFMWLDKLGLSALSGFKTVLRQSFFNGNYALISHDFDPYPDYFLTVLYKRLVQGPVFNVTSSTDKVRMYASCANPSSYQKGALTVYILNVKNRSTTLNFSQFQGYQYELYLLTPGDERGLRSHFVALNGKKLTMINEELPPLHPQISTGRITFPRYSFGFVVIPQAGVRFCSEM